MRIVDLTMLIHEGMMTYPSGWHPQVHIMQLGRLGMEGRETRRIVMGTHTGTHIDAPRHFIAGGDTVDQISISRLIGSARKVDLRNRDGKRSITAEDIQGDGDESALVLQYGWDDKVDTSEYYVDYPYLSASAVKYIISNGYQIVAMDTPSPDNPTSGLVPAHKLFLEAGIVLVEYLVNLGDLRHDRFDIFVAPLKIKGGDGAPARVFAIEGD